MKTEAVVQAFMALLRAQQFDDMPKFVVATSPSETLDILSVYASDDLKTIYIDVEVPNKETPVVAVSQLLLTYDGKKAVAYKDIIYVQ